MGSYETFAKVYDDFMDNIIQGVSLTLDELN